MDVAQLILALSAGAAVAGQAVIEEVTKDAYSALKSTVATVFGRNAERIIVRLEADPNAEQIKDELKAAIPAIPAEETEELSQKIDTLLSALQADAQAKDILATAAHIKLDIDAGGQVTLEALHGAQRIEVKSKSKGDFTLRNVQMSSGPNRGN